VTATVNVTTAPRAIEAGADCALVVNPPAVRGPATFAAVAVDAAIGTVHSAKAAAPTKPQRRRRRSACGAGAWFRPGRCTMAVSSFVTVSQEL
jgi:hypothetical protein